MEYTVQKLGQIAGVSPRTLRYYDQIGLLRPARNTSSGYRIYGRAEVDLLQQILFFRALGFPLARIREIITAPDFDQVQALREHRDKLLEKRAQLDQLIANVEKSIASREGRVTMTDEEKFQGFMRQMVEENERKYGAEALQRYGREAVEKANQKVLSMTRAQYQEAANINSQLMETLKEAYKTGDAAGELAQKAADLHRQWLSYYWPQYDKEAHANLVQMYVDDERFTQYYDREQPGLAAFLRDAVHICTGRKGGQK
ncbi:MAG TPA: MerR family transcriptional regulator [Bacillota bacterium]|nr:MerR family transcriptional regulator [Bacillota bacterium]HPZ90412.1 MerR family transcriptional regulator [Bacillota bacterium]